MAPDTVFEKILKYFPILKNFSILRISIDLKLNQLYKIHAEVDQENLNLLRT